MLFTTIVYAFEARVAQLLEFRTTAAHEGVESELRHNKMG
jgi:hypothetical protein